MKKLMIAAAIVCAAVASQAATFGWSTADCFMPYVIADIKVGDNQPSQTSGATSKTIAGWASSGAAFSAIIEMTYGGETVKTTVDALAYSSKKVSVANLANSLFELPASGEKAIDYSIVISGEYTKNGTTYTITSSTIEDTITLTPMSSMKLDTVAPTSWSITTSAVPEPTSGLLLLLGVGVMALRRKRV